MGGDDRELMGRLLDAARRDVAPDEAERQAKIVDRVLGGAIGGGGGDGPFSGARPGRSWLVGVSAAGVGAIALVGAGLLAMGRGPTADQGNAATPARVDTPAPDGAPAERDPTGQQSGMAAMATGTSVWELPSVSTASRPAPSGAPSAAPASAPADELALELAALEGARRRLRDHDPAGAMKLLDDFDRRFPRPRAGEEAIVLRVEVLLGMGRTADAQRIGRDFVARRPDSIYRARVVQLLGDAAP